MKITAYLIGLLVLMGIASAIVPVDTLPLTILSDEQTLRNDGDSWVSSTIFTPHPAWTSEITDASWIWSSYPVSEDSATQGETVTFKRHFNLPSCEAGVHKGSIDISADNTFVLYLNGHKVGEELTEYTFSSKHHYDLTAFLESGPNVLKIEAANLGGDYTPDQNPAAIIFKANIDCDESDNEVPEFGTIAALVAAFGGLGIMFVSRRN